MLPTEMCGEITIVEINDRKVNTGKSNICIEDISAGGLKFYSHLNFPIENTLYEVKLILYGKSYKFYASLRWKDINKRGDLSYGIMFHLNEDEREQLIQLMIKLSVDSKKSYSNISVYKKCDKKCSIESNLKRAL